MKHIKLYYKTLLYYIGYGLLMTLIIVPSYYFYIKQYHIKEMNGFLLLQKRKIVDHSLRTLKESDIITWNSFNESMTILPDSGQTEKDIFKTENIYSTHENEYVLHRVLYSIIEIEGEKYILIIRLDIDEFQEILYKSTRLQLLLFVCLILGMVIITAFIQRILWKPFYKTISLIENFDIQYHDVPKFMSSSTKEFEQLNHAIENLINNNLQAYKNQKEFLENVSHEIQTPVAVFLSKLDILMQQSGLTEEQLKIIQTLYDVCSRLVRMNKNLLLLAKIDNNQFSDTEKLNVAVIVEKSLSFLSEHIKVKNISIEKLITEDNISLAVNRTLLENLVNNLITNAIKHNINGGKIRIKLDTNSLDIFNTGIDHPLDNSKLFRRFGNTNSTIQGTGLGLGLAIIYQTCKLYGWQINYSFESNMHRFTVLF